MPSNVSPDDTVVALETALLAVAAAAVATDLVLFARLTPPTLAEPLRLLLAAGAGIAASLAVAAGVSDGRPLVAVGAVAAVPIAGLYAYTGLLLPWTRLSFVLGQAGVELTLSVPVIGSVLADVLFGGFTLSQATLERAYRVHYGLVVAVVVVVVGRTTMLLRGRIDSSPA